MKVSQIAVQCYTLREHVQTAPQFAASMRRVREIGYPAVQISGVGPIDARDIRRMTDAEGLVICATHEPAREIVERPEAVAEKLAVLGCRHTAYPAPHFELRTRADVQRLADDLNHAGAVLRAAGMTLSYHNHELEFRKVDGQPVLEILFAATDRALVCAELDTYWVQAGGQDPALWCERMRGRMPLIHLKDYGVHPDERAPVMAALGEGNLDWPKILAAAEASGCEWFIVEQDRGFSDAFAAIRTSFEFLSRYTAA